MDDELGDLDLNKYLALTRRLLPERAALATCRAGELVSQVGELAMDAVVARLGQHAASVDRATEGEAAERADDRQPDLDQWWQTDGCFEIGDARVMCFVLKDHHRVPFGAVLIGHGLENPLDSAVAEDIARPVAECIAREIALNRELNEMSGELTDRYEELNLVYDTQDQVQDFKETGKHLKQLVDNCRSYLDVALCALILRDQHMVLYDHSAAIEPGDAQLTVEQLQGRLYDWVTSSRQLVVVNDVDDPAAAAACKGLPYKISASPILTGSNHAGGLLVVLNLYNHPDFKNSDKNLMDVMARKASKIVQSSFDSLTGMAKRPGFEFQLAKTLEKANEYGTEHAVLVLDLDRTQVVNDTLGYEAGDRIIKMAAKVVEDAVRADDIVARLGGDQFGVLVRNCSPKAAEGIADKLCKTIRALEIHARGQRAESSVSIGVYALRGDETAAANVLACAEVACASAKELGGNQSYVYLDGDEEIIRRKSYMHLVGRIQETLRSGRFRLYCQAIDPLQECGASSPHAEILLRMLDDDDSVLSPGLFMPAAERYHLMPAIDRWVIGETFAQLAKAEIFKRVPDLVVSMNLSGQSLSDTAFADFVLGVVRETAVPPANVCFEITETAAIGDIALAQAFMRVIKDEGILFSLDDFGTGVSSFSYLKELPVDYLKIDGSFVKDICTDPIAETMVSAINQVGHTMGLQTVGEYVETEEIRERLRALGIDYGQGYGIARPVPLDEYLQALLDVHARQAS